MERQPNDLGSSAGPDISARVSLLSTLNAPFLGHMIRAFSASGIPIDSVILDSKLESTKDLAIHEERTRGRFPQVPLHEFEAQYIPIFSVAHHSSDVTAELVRKRQIDLLINAGTPRILRSNVLGSPRIGVLSCHPGLLPSLRGCTCVEWAVYLDEQVGNTVYFMNESIDGGPIVLKEGLVFRKTDTYVDVRTSVYQNGLRLLTQGVKKVITEGLTPRSLEAQGEGRYYRVIDAEKMQQVVAKLQGGDYAYQE